MSDKTSIAADANGMVYGFMDLVDFQEELGQAIDGNSIYPSEGILKERHPCCMSCGIIKVSIEILDKIPEVHQEGCRYGFMDHKSLFYELGIANMGSRVFPSENDCRAGEGRRIDAGVYPVVVKMVKVVREASRDLERARPIRKGLKFKRHAEMSANPYPMLIELTTRLRGHLQKWQESHRDEKYSVPFRCQPPYLIRTLDNIEKYCAERMQSTDELEDILAICKMHRGFGHARACMVMLGIATWDEIREHFYQTRTAFPEVPDEELSAHLDPDSWFRLDIGGEG